MNERSDSRCYPDRRTKSPSAGFPTALVLALILATTWACGGGSDASSLDSAATPPNNSNAAAPGAVAGDDGVGSSMDAGVGTRVLIAGTSLTAGLGLDPEDAYPALLQRKADSAGFAVRIENAGLSGETSAGLLRRLGWLLREPASVVVVETGANDGLRGLDVAATRENLRGIAQELRRALPGARLLIVQMEAPPNLGEEYTTRFRAMYGEVAREFDAELVPFLLTDVAGVAELNQADGIHPNEAGARRVAETVWEVLAPVLAQVDRARNVG